MQKIWTYFEIAGRMATSKDDRRTYRIGCLAIRNDGAKVRARNESSRVPTPYAHAEARISTRIDHGAIVYIARVKNNGEFGMAKPCKNCIRFLRSKKVKRAYYTTGASSWGFIDP